MIISGGSAPGEGRILLYQFESSPTAFQEGEEIAFEDPAIGGLNTLENAFVRDPYPTYGPRTITSHPALLSFTPQGQSVRFVRGQGTEALNAGGSRVIGNVSGAVGFYNPVLVRASNIQNEPAWVAGDNINCQSGTDGGAKGLFGYKFQVTAVLGFGVYTEDWYVIYASTDAWQTTDFTRELHRESWTGTLLSSAYGTFSADIEEVIHLESNVYDGGNLRPVMALSTHSYNYNDGVLRKPAVHSFGDHTVPYKGDFVFRDTLPENSSWPDRKRRFWVLTGTESAAPTVGEIVDTSNHTISSLAKKGTLVANPSAGVWHVEQISGPPFTLEDAWIGATSGQTLTTLTDAAHMDSVLDAARAAKQGRSFTTELLAEDGKLITSYLFGNVTYPYQTRGIDDNRTMTSAVLSAATPLLVEGGGDSATATSNHGVYWLVPSPASPSTDEGCTFVFHPKIPSGFVWIEGYGAHLLHNLSTSGFARAPAVIALFAVGGQSKENAIPNFWGGSGQIVAGVEKRNGYIHRLEVQETQEKVIRVDSAGGGMPGYDVTTSPNHTPKWAIGAATYWAPFRPFMVFPHNERTIELYVEAISGIEPQVGMVIKIGTSSGVSTVYPGGMAKRGSIAYVEKYGQGVIGGGGTVTPTVTAYRLFVDLGKSSANGEGYPYEIGFGTGATVHVP
ncbi:MAG: hypothetical protein KDB07_09705, partial [Planctomycetes bacterium]|nr:hypothetical protein [Planctomycetota bacterium]